ncbi:type II secretion system protein N [Sphingomonas sp. S-NIH.Pt15_0812]|uniref:type II secretion system protein N n=1 Tax=Sphingomonas sp. S-NIH.Pt15_0812 TaxID=1920129 RepID=UPI000F7EC68A|nr:type II secretion system protein N [Sphingomonas sp. S-NIH.Pt15_0812]RSU51157.1 type II secretory protein PulC [Sphingomonas sp. S-NIH.Pt15_0812]
MRLKLDARARRWLRRIPVVNVYSLAELVLMGALAVQCARFVWVVATPVGPVGDWRPAGVTFPGSPAAILSQFDPFFRLNAPQAGPATVTPLQLTLFGIRLDEATGRGSAIVAGADGVQKSVAVGEEIQPGVTLKAVAFDHITLDRGGTAEDLFLDQSDAPPPPPPTGTAPAGPEIGSRAAGAIPVLGGGPAPAGTGVPVGQLRQEIGFIPRIDGGRISGLVVRPQGSGAAFRQAGLREGDVVTAIGGRAVSGPGDLDRIATDYAGGGNVPITVERGQQTLALAITIAAPSK